MFANIIVPVDGSEPSNQAIDLACSLSKALGAKVTLCHVVPVPRPPHDGGGFAREEILDEEVKGGHAVLETARARAASKGISPATVLQSGPVAEAVLDEARTRGCDAIVMGSRGRGAVARAVLGSVTYDVIHRSSLPVIIAPHVRG
jgi:nucleotide-binding universal stress UspA family protein